MKKQSKFLIPALLAMFAIPCPTKADVLVSADFDAGYTTGALNGQSGSGDVNLSGSWNALPMAQVVAATGANDLTYNVAGGGTISSGSNVVQYVSNNPASGSGYNNEVFSRSLTAPISGQTVYARVVVAGLNISTNPGLQLDFFANNTGTGSGLYDLANGTGLGSFGNGVTGAGIGNNYSTNKQATSSVLTATPSLLVAAFNWDAATSSYDSVSFWLNPSATMGAPDATALTLNGTTSIQQIGLADVNMGAGQIYDFDSFAIGTQWSDVVTPASVPEPSSWALAITSLSALFLVLRRRFRMGN